MSDETIYFVQVGSHGPVKIGRSRKPGARLAALQGAHFERLHLIGLTPGGMLVEEKLHVKLAPFALGREWFQPAAEVLAEIAEPVARVADALDVAVVAREHLQRAIALLRGSDAESGHAELRTVVALLSGVAAETVASLSLVVEETA